MKKRPILIFLVVVSILTVGIILFFNYPFILNREQKEHMLLSQSGQKVIAPLEGIDFTSGINYAYLIFSDQDTRELPNGMKRKNVFKCDENTDLQLLKDHFRFLKSGGDMSTCESKIFIYKDKKLVYHSAFVLNDSSIGLQSSSFGWAEAMNREALKRSFLRFKPVTSPIVKL